MAEAFETELYAAGRKILAVALSTAPPSSRTTADHVPARI